MERIPVCEPVLSERELEYVTDAIRTNWISSGGKYLQRFEELFAAYCGMKYGIGVTNGTAALHLALRTAGIGPGDEVILPAFSMIAPAFAVVYCGARPVFVDADPGTWTINVEALPKVATSRTKAVMPVHIYGHPCDMDGVLDFAVERGIRVIEDAAEAHGAEYKGRRAGSLGELACFSFYANKIITTGEGGMVVTAEKEFAARARWLRNLAFDRERRFIHEEVAFNYRMTNVAAAIGLAQLERIMDFVAARRRNAAHYRERLRDIPGLTLPSEAPWARSVYWMYGILVDEEAFGLSRDGLAKALEAEGIETRYFFTPLHLQPSLLNLGVPKGQRFPVAEMLGQRGLYLPSGSGLTREQIDRVVAEIEHAHAGAV